MTLPWHSHDTPDDTLDDTFDDTPDDTPDNSQQLIDNYDNSSFYFVEDWPITYNDTFLNKNV